MPITKCMMAGTDLGSWTANLRGIPPSQPQSHTNYPSHASVIGFQSETCIFLWTAQIYNFLIVVGLQLLYLLQSKCFLFKLQIMNENTLINLHQFKIQYSVFHSQALGISLRSFSI